MTRAGRIAFWLVVVGQVSLLLAFVGVREYRLTAGTEVVLQTAPVDPRSLLQGDYVVLRYEIGEVPEFLKGVEEGGTIYVWLTKTGQVWSANGHVTIRPTDAGERLFIKGTVGSDGWLDFGMGTYFVPEGGGREIERAEDVKVKAMVGRSGKAVIKDVYVDGVSLATGLEVDLGPAEAEADASKRRPLAKPTPARPEPVPTPTG